MKERRHRIDPKINGYARELRESATVPEQILWGQLRAKQLGGLRFRRQHPIGRYIVDFCCVDSKLVIEIDGESHEGRQDYDRERQKSIQALGFKVFRVTNDDVLGNLEGVLEAIFTAAFSGDALPSPDPSLQGRGNKPR